MNHTFHDDIPAWEDSMPPWLEELEACASESPPPAPEPAPDPASGLPDIVVNGRQLPEVTDEAWRALLAGPFGPQLYLYGGSFMHLDTRLPGESRLSRVDQNKLSAFLRRSVTWLRDKGEQGLVDTTVPHALPQDMMALPSHHLPRLARVARVPSLVSGGFFLDRPGYHPDAQTYLDLPRGLQDLSRATWAPEKAKAWLVDELLGDFLFVDDSDRVHAPAALLTPFVRPSFQGPTPLFIIEAPTEGTGKSLLADVLHRVITGTPSQPMTLPRSHDAIRKRITAQLPQAPPVVLWDNLAETVDSASLAAVITSQEWADRRLGESEMLRLPNEALWLATGNSPMMSRELSRRCVRIRLDAHSSRPWKGRSYRHPNLSRWVDQHRGELVQAVCSLIRHWLEADRPQAPKRRGSFERLAPLGEGRAGHPHLAGDGVEVFASK